jgi:hypothetical protein
LFGHSPRNSITILATSALSERTIAFNMHPEVGIDTCARTNTLNPPQKIPDSGGRCAIASACSVGNFLWWIQGVGSGTSINANFGVHIKGNGAL